MSNLSQVLSEYSVPLQVWLSPEARASVADVLISTMGDKANILTHPIPQIAQLKGPAVLVITANELAGADQEALRALSQTAHPGRSVLIGGTSDRDTLMNAINNWGVIRVVGSSASEEAIVGAVREAGAYLNREVAMETAIEDLDIETTMIDSAIDQLEDSRDRTVQIDRTNIATTFTAGMIQVLEREKSTLSSILSDLTGEQEPAIHQCIQGMDALASIIEKAHDHAIERAAGLPPADDPLDPLLREICTLLKSNVEGHLGSGALTSIDPLALSHAMLSLCRHHSSAGLTSIDSHRSGSTAIITVTFQAPLTEDFMDALEPKSWTILKTAGCDIQIKNDKKSIELMLPTQDAAHV